MNLDKMYAVLKETEDDEIIESVYEFIKYQERKLRNDKGEPEEVKQRD